MNLRKLVRAALLLSVIGPLAPWPGFGAVKLTSDQQAAWDTMRDKSFIIANTTNKDWTIAYLGIPDELDKSSKLDLKGQSVTVLEFDPKKKSYKEGKAVAEGGTLVIKAQGVLVFNVTPPAKGWFDDARNPFVGAFNLVDPANASRSLRIKRKGGDKNASKVPEYAFQRGENIAGALENFPGSSYGADDHPTFGDFGFVIVGDKFN